MPTDAGSARLTGGLVSPNLFAMLGASARLGRTLDAADDAAGSNVVVISTGAWQRYFQGDPGILGRTITLKTLGPEAGFLDGTPLTIVGVMPASFDFPLPNMDYWAPITNGSPARKSGRKRHRALAGRRLHRRGHRRGQRHRRRRAAEAHLGSLVETAAAG